MRKFFLTFLILALLCPRAAAAEQKYIALTFDGAPEEADSLLDGLQKYGAHATFFLGEEWVAQHPEQVSAIARKSHEIGLFCPTRAGADPISRRKIGAHLAATRALLPEGVKARFVRPENGDYTDALTQVAGVTRLAILGWSLSPGDGQRIVRLRDGDVIRLDGFNVRGSLSLADQLSKQGYQMVTVSELVKIRRVRIHPGMLYQAFPPETKQQAPS